MSNSTGDGDISQRDTLIHAGVDRAEVLICTIPSSLLKGASNLKLLRQLRELNPNAQILMHADMLPELQELYAAGASYVSLPRLGQAEELLRAIHAAQQDGLGALRAAQSQQLNDRHEVLR